MKIWLGTTRSALAVVLVAVLVTAGGCGDSPELGKVHGTVMLNGKPLDKIQVEFWPLNSGPRSMGVTDSEGKFVLKTDDGEHRDGAAVGPNKVVLKDIGIISDEFKGKSFRELEEVDVTKGQKPRISTEYYNPEKTSLTKEVKSGENEFQIDVNAG